MKIFICIISILFTLKLNAQISEKHDCELQDKNLKWLDQIIKANNNEKIELIKSKIISDTLYKKTIPKFKLHDSSLNFDTEDSSGNLCGIKILFVLEYSKRKTIKLNLLDNPEYFSILNKINSNNIKIWILNSKQGQAIYGTMGSSGVIYLRIENKELKKFLKSKIKTHKLN